MKEIISLPWFWILFTEFSASLCNFHRMECVPKFF